MKILTADIDQFYLTKTFGFPDYTYIKGVLTDLAFHPNNTPKELFNLYNLKSLRLHHNNDFDLDIQTIVRGIKNLQQIRYIYTNYEGHYMNLKDKLLDEPIFRDRCRKQVIKYNHISLLWT